MKQSRFVVAYAGGAAATAALRAFAASPDTEVVTLTLDLGQGDTGVIREAALAAGAARAHVLDTRDEFARAHLLPALQAGVAPGGWRAIVRSLGGALAAARLRDIAAIEQAAVSDALSHDVDENLAGRVVTDGNYRLTIEASRTPDAPAHVALGFERGVPVTINDVSLPLTELLESLAIIAGRHGVGRIEEVEAPAAVVLHTALRSRRDGVVHLTLFKGTCEEAPELVTQ